MPHSSGGGSHGGGGHGGHGGFGGAGGASGRRSSTHFAGAKRYVYYRNRKPVMVYANYDISKDRSTSMALFVFAFTLSYVALVFILMAVMAVMPVIKKRTNYDTKIVIEDNAGIIDDEDEADLKKELKEFLDKTGITPAFVTVNNEDWKRDNRTSLERYSYDLYLDMFDDEKHWLIVYSEPEVPDPEFNDWYWEGMQGDNTDSILSKSKTRIFNKEFQKNLLKRDKYTVAQALTRSFDSFNEVVMQKDKDTWVVAVIFWPLSALAVTGVVFLCIGGIKAGKSAKSAFECKEEVVRQAKCNYCGGVYVIGHHNTCPHCQAQIPYEHTLVHANSVSDMV